MENVIETEISKKIHCEGSGFFYAKNNSHLTNLSFNFL